MGHEKFKNGISRRQFGSRVLGMGASAAIAGTLPGIASSETVKKGGMIRIAMESSDPSESMDPI